MAVNFAYEVYVFILAGIFNIPENLTTWDRRLYFPPGRKSCYGFLPFLAGFELANLGFNGIYDNH
jgi:hypothetical protein